MGSEHQLVPVTVHSDRTEPFCVSAVPGIPHCVVVSFENRQRTMAACESGEVVVALRSPNRCAARANADQSRVCVAVNRRSETLLAVAELIEEIIDRLDADGVAEDRAARRCVPRF